MTQTCRFVATDEPRALTGRHDDECADDDCKGCSPCPAEHCLTCGRNHAAVTCTECVNAVRGDLDAIHALCGDLPDEAADRGVNSEAMMLLGPAANAEAWANRAMSAVMGRVDAAYLEDCRDELHPLWVLGTWSDVWRDALDQPSDLRITIPRAWSYLSDHLHELAAMVEPDFSQFAGEVRACRGHLEDVLHDGERDERSRVPCRECGTRLVKVYSDQAKDDHWRCPKRRCGQRLNAEEFARAKHWHLSSEWAGAYVRVSEALSAVARPERTIREWVRRGLVESSRDEKTGALMVWWPDVRHMHLITPTRKRAMV